MKLLFALLGVLILSSLATAAEDSSTTSATAGISAPGNPWGILADASGPAKPRVPGASEPEPAVETDSPAEPVKVEVILASPTPVVDDVSGALARAQDRIAELESALEARGQQVQRLQEHIFEASVYAETPAQPNDDKGVKALEAEREMLLGQVRQLSARLAETVRNYNAAAHEATELGLVLRTRDQSVMALQGYLEEANRALEIARNEPVADSPAEPVAEPTPTPEPTATTATATPNSAAEDILRRLEEGARKLKAAGH